MVVTRWATGGTHRDEFREISPSAAQVRSTGIQFDRIINGKIDESWVAYHFFTDSVLDPGQIEQLSAMLQCAFPDLRIFQADTVSEGDKVALRWIMSGTHEGEFMGVTPTGSKLQLWV